MLTCKEASRSISKAQDNPLSWRERLALGMHLLFCASCRQYERQVRWLHDLSQAMTAPCRGAHLEESTKARLREQIHDLAAREDVEK
ncbi:zf-HC2 domain-containing protein [Acidithiobacillus sp. CV18-2]|nr:zf-HC2 domain-containing protein [Acidithiobacillus sp. CV18-3]MBU2758138.1 zf-HC2 domain-containing protein [Acidithiobacillus sp. BN09-2]MBU2764402.1 zf-HC2 domain-containing protein [Acidithiobacillus caldus]MBU2777425.1 zf-HC2 domain-containing protein [Acidithiobacillus sp. CV18-2]MBU2800180.1 zf-HC2 domain-containing protein [Acidithiobacillus sp. VAN18-4]